MGRYLYLIASITGLCFLSIVPLDAQNNGGGAPDQSNIVIDRLRSDIQELKAENRELRNRIKELETTTNASESTTSDETLRREIQDLRELLRRYRDAAADLVQIVADSDTDFITVERGESTTKETDQSEEVEREEKNRQEPNPELQGEWIVDDSRPYPIRREPLDEQVTFTTGPNDTLSKIAHQYYHDAELWFRLFLVNEDRLDSPDNLPPGTTLQLPPIDRIKHK